MDYLSQVLLLFDPHIVEFVLCLRVLSMAQYCGE